MKLTLVVVLCGIGAALIALWAIAATGMRVPQRVRSVRASAAGPAVAGDGSIR